jgi:hypothetical protein
MDLKFSAWGGEESANDGRAGRGSSSERIVVL